MPSLYLMVGDGLVGEHEVGYSIEIFYIQR